MVKRTLETFECDECGEEAVRYLIEYPDGQYALDRCEKHEGKILKLRDEKGTWIHRNGGRTAFKVSTPEDILKQKK